MIERIPLNREVTRQAVTILIAVTAAWLAVGYQPWALSLMVGALGVLYLLVPPTLHLPRLLVILFGLFIGVALLAFGPASLFPTSYRATFLAQGFDMGWMLTPQPWTTFEDITLSTAGILWALNCFSGIRMKSNRAMLLSIFVLALLPVAISVIINGTSTSDQVPDLSIGQFKNRTLTGDMLMMSGLAAFACGFTKASSNRGYGLGWFLVSSVFMCALARDDSRGPFVLFWVGILAYLLMQKSYRQNVKWVAGSLVFGVVMVASALAVGGKGLMARFGDLAMGNELRGATFLDTLSLILKNPIYGIGLGNFDAIFNTVRDRSLHTPFRMLFPESDWLWLGAETGLAGVVAFGAILVCMCFSYFKPGVASFPTPLSCVIMLILFLHSWVDAPAHAVGTCWNYLFLIGLGVSRVNQVTDIVPPLWMMRLLGLGLIGLAGLRLQSASTAPLMPTGASRDFVQTAIRQNKLGEQIRIINDSMKWDPINYLLFYQRGLLEMENADTIKNTMGDFKKSLFLEQTAPQIPDLIQKVCRECNLPEASDIRKEMTRRTISRDASFFRTYYDPTLDSPNDQGLSTLANGNPEMQAIAVLMQDPSRFDSWLGNLLTANEPLNRVSPDTRKALFDRWAAQGDCAKLVIEWLDHPNWRPFGTKAYLVALARLNRLPEAVNYALELFKPSKLPDLTPDIDLHQIRREYELSHGVYSGIQVYLALTKAGDKEEAKSVLEQVSALPGCPDYVHYLLGQELHNEEKDDEAWKALYPLVEKS